MLHNVLVGCILLNQATGQRLGTVCIIHPPTDIKPTYSLLLLLAAIKDLKLISGTQRCRIV